MGFLSKLFGKKEPEQPGMGSPDLSGNMDGQNNGQDMSGNPPSGQQM